MARQKKVVLSGVSRKQMEEAFCNYALADANIQQINASIDEQVTRIRETHQDNLAFLEKQKSDAFEVMQCFAMENREVLFERKKSMETAHGVLGFRTSTPALKTRKGFTWAAVLELLRDKAPSFIRVKEEVNKDRIRDGREEKEVQEVMEKCGLCVVQEETFFVEPKKEEQPAHA